MKKIVEKMGRDRTDYLELFASRRGTTESDFEACNYSIKVGGKRLRPNDYERSISAIWRKRKSN